MTEQDRDIDRQREEDMRAIRASFHRINKYLRYMVWTFTAAIAVSMGAVVVTMIIFFLKH